PSSGGLDLSVRWQFWSKRAVLRLYCNDLFETSGINPAIDFKGQNMRMNFSCYRMFGASFTYRFGSYKEKQRKEVDMSRFKK
ncbi:MAG: signal protein, partial [Prevotellaceae bacterium]|nr:outer membrane beta-barrel family protein [Prevotella sp.]MDD7258314.1 signal protein [Prevotellaceae bacterium]MDY6129895.1 signal protein [Prevotella sp.]